MATLPQERGLHRRPKHQPLEPDARASSVARNYESRPSGDDVLAAYPLALELDVHTTFLGLAVGSNDPAAVAQTIARPDHVEKAELDYAGRCSARAS